MAYDREKIWRTERGGVEREGAGMGQRGLIVCVESFLREMITVISFFFFFE